VSGRQGGLLETEAVLMRKLCVFMQAQEEKLQILRSLVNSLTLSLQSYTYIYIYIYRYIYIYMEPLVKPEIITP
jgi:hypothetical protein